MKYKLTLAFVLAFGIVSCGSDKNAVTTDTFRIQEPQIVFKKTKEQKGFSAFSQQVKPDLTIADEIQFQDGENAFNVLFNINCRFDQKEVRNSGFITSPKRIAFFSFLSPEQLRLIGEYKDGVSCAVDFVALNTNNSRHYFKLPLIQMKDDLSANELSLLHFKKMGSTSELNFEQWPDHFIKLAKAGSSQIYLNCSSAEKILAVAADRLNLSSLPLQEMNLDWSLGIQNCRISQVQNEIVVATSSNFIILPPTLNTQFKEQMLDHPYNISRGFDPYLQAATYRVDVTNNDPFTIHLRLRKQDMNFYGSDSSHRFKGIIMVNRQDGQPAMELSNDLLVDIKPKQTISLFHYALIDKDHCKQIYNSAFHSPNPINFEIVSQKLFMIEEIVLKKHTVTAYSIPTNTNWTNQDVANFCSNIPTQPPPTVPRR